MQFVTDGGAIVVLDASAGTVLGGTSAAIYPYTPVSNDAITAAPLYYSGILVVGSTGGKLYFIDRYTGTGLKVLKTYDFGSSESVSGVGYDVNVNRFMVSTSNASTKDGKLYYFDLITDPTSSFK